MDPTLDLPGACGRPDDPQRRLWLTATGVAGGAAAVATSVPFVASFAPSERARAAGGVVEVDVDDLAPGQAKTVEWRGKPIWIVRRTAAMLAALDGHDADLVDPHSKAPQQPEAMRHRARSLREDVFVAIGLCTHLGCAPTAVAAGTPNPSLPHDWPGGYFCPCHGSTFDGAGRVYRNKPAPSNLEIPPYRFVTATRIAIGESDAA